MNRYNRHPLYRKKFICNIVNICNYHNNYYIIEVFVRFVMKHDYYFTLEEKLVVST